MIEHPPTSKHESRNAYVSKNVEAAKHSASNSIGQIAHEERVHHDVLACGSHNHRHANNCRVHRFGVCNLIELNNQDRPDQERNWREEVCWQPVCQFAQDGKRYDHSDYADEENILVDTLRLVVVHQYALIDEIENPEHEVH